MSTSLNQQMIKRAMCYPNVLKSLLQIERKSLHKKETLREAVSN
jgi:hypothetical protein